MSPARTQFVAVVAALAAVVTALPAAAAPEGIPDLLPVLAEPLERGDLLVTELADVAPTTKTVDGDVDDWVGTSARIAGGTHFDAGELVHTDFLWDAYGADDGGDVDRWQFAGLFYAETRANRVDDLLRTSGSQLGVPEPVGAPDEYGDATDLEVADLVDLRIAADDDEVHVLVRTANLADPDDLVVLLLADTGAGGTPADPSLGLPDDHRFDVVLPVSTGVVGAPDGVTVAGNADGYTNAVEIAVPADLVAPDGELDLAVITGVRAEDGTIVPANIAFRHVEPVDIYNDRMQAFALHGDAPEGSTIDLFSSGPVALTDLRRGRTQAVRPGPGYHERQFDSGDTISTERGRDGRIQPYGLYVPDDFDPTAVTPTTFWLHYRGGKAHSGGAINPRMIREYAREDPSGIGLSEGPGNLVVTPHARGTSFWYVSRSHQDFFEVYDDVHGLMPNIDPARRYLAGYSMGGYGTWLLGSLYPDLFAAGHSVSGALTQGAWTGVPDGGQCQVSDGETGLCYIEANGGDAAAQLSFRVVDNLRHVPVHVDHGSNDELVPATGVLLQATRLVELGYRTRMQTFPGYEHFTQAIVDEFADGAAYLQQFTTPRDPRQVTYRVVPALVRALNTVRLEEGREPFTFDPDGAYWVDDVEVRDPDPDDPTTSGIVDVVAEPLDEDPYLAEPVTETGAVSPGHSTPFARYGQSWVDDPLGATAIRNAFTATLDGVAAVTLDGERMGLARDAELVGTMTTDGPATVTLTGVGAGTGVLRCDCGTERPVTWTDDRVDLELTEAGVWTFAAAPTTPGEDEGEEPTTPPDPTDSEDDDSEDGEGPDDGQGPDDDDDGGVVRTGGGDRVATAVDVSRSSFDRADTVVLARADDYPDALTGAPLAAQLDAPILLTDPTALDDAVRGELLRLGATDVVVLGGDAAVSGDVVDTLERDGLQVRRVAGATRWATAALVAAKLERTDDAWVVEGANADPARGWPDAVAVAPVAARQGRPILLTTRDAVPSETTAALAALGVERITVAGGEAAVGRDVAATLAATVTVDRIAGADRYATALAVAAILPPTGTTTWLATGLDWPDALAAGPAVAAAGDRLLLVDGRDAVAAERVVGTLEPGSSVRLLGGPTAITPAVAASVTRRVR